MKLSVYIPTLERDALFERCMRSIERSIVVAGDEVLSPNEYEIVVIEGVSPLSEARNEGLRRTTGEWIASVDADDEVADDWFGEICRAIIAAERKGEVDDIIFDHEMIGARHRCARVYGREPIVDGKTVAADMLRDVRLRSYVWSHVMRRRLWRDEAFERIPVLEDYVTMPRVLARARKVAYVAKPLYRYIMREGSLSNGDLARRREIFGIAMRRAGLYGGPAVVGTSFLAYDLRYDAMDSDGLALKWIRRHLIRTVCDGEVSWKWKLKFCVAATGLMIRSPK